jgi:hypothetical protein
MMVAARLTRRSGALLTGAAAVVVYVAALRLGFAYDDVALIPQNPRVHSLGNALRVFAWPYWGGSELAIYRPLTTLTFLLDWAASSGRPAWFHFTNLLWNAGACMLGFLLLAELFTLPAALFGALIFAVHPAHVEAVANVVGRAEMIGAVFLFGACLLWVRRTETSQRRLAAVGALFGLALLAKESTAMLPALLVLLDFARSRWRLERASVAGYARTEWPLAAVCAMVLACYIALRFAVLGRFGPAQLDPALEGSADRVLTALQAWPQFARLAFFPRTLLADYSPRIILPAVSWTTSAALGAAILAALLAGSISAARRGHARSALGLFWFPITILPVSNLIVPIGIVVAERTLYIPLFALAIGAAAAAERLAAGRRVAPQLGFGIAAAVVALLCARTITRVPEWNSTDSVFAALLRDRPDSFRAHWHFARVARTAGNLDLSARQYAEALRLWPVREGLVTEAAALAVMQQRLGDGRKLAEFGVSRWPANVPLHRLLAGTALDLGDTTTALRALRAGLRLQPQDAMLQRMNAALEPYLRKKNAH